MTPPEPIRIALVGIGGYGGHYLERLLRLQDTLGVRLVGAIDPYPERAPRRDELVAAQIPIFPALADFYAADSADLVIISSPIHLHIPQTRLALQQGASVLCEKPLAGSLEEGLETLALEQAGSQFVAVGYNWSFSDPIHALKRDIARGLFGRPLRLKSLTLWQRWRPYYTRNAWAGAIRSAAGAPILDSPVNNATAHHLHNMFYVLGQTPETSAQPVDVQAECYRANAIENYDTAALRAHTGTGVEILFYTAHPVAEDTGPIFHFAFENGAVSYAGRGSEIVAHLANGRIIQYGDPEAVDHVANKIQHAVACLRTGSRPLCGIEAASAQTRCMLGVQASAQIVDFPAELIHDEGERGWVEGLDALWHDCYTRNLLPAERGDVPWAQAGRLIELAQG